MAILSAAAAPHIAFVVFFFRNDTTTTVHGTRAEFIFDVFLLCATSRNEQMQLYMMMIWTMVPYSGFSLIFRYAASLASILLEILFYAHFKKRGDDVERSMRCK